jgi:branched-subunit amino acid ABC-type transport system permease component
MVILSIARWREDVHLFVIGALAIAVATLGLTRVRRRPRELRTHVISFGASYILLLTAFYVDNGKNLPLWNRLPPISYWLIPSAVGLPLIIRALFRHPLLRRSEP